MDARVGPFKPHTLYSVLAGLLLVIALRGTAVADQRSQLLIHSSLDPLHNKWQFRWGDSPRAPDGTPLWALDSATNRNWTSFTMPHVFKDAQRRRFLWLRVPIPDKKWRDPALAIYTVDQIFEVYLGRKRIYVFGNLEQHPLNPFIGFSNHVIPIPHEAAGKFLCFRIYSEFYKIGIVGKISIRERAQHFIRILGDSLDAVVLGTLSIMLGVVSFIFFFLRMTKLKQSVFLWFGLFQTAIGFFIIAQTELRTFIWDNPRFWLYADFYSLFLIPPSCLAFLEWIIDVRYKKVMHYAWLSQIVLFFILVFLDQTGLVHAHNVLLWFEYLLLANIALILITTLASALRGNAQSRIFALGLAILATFGLHDFLVDVNVLSWNHTMVHWGTFSFSLALLAILIRNYLDVNSQLLASQKEMEIASSAQNAILTSPFYYQNIEQLSIEVFYLPMNRAVSGDYYNISRIKDGVASIMIADASGHGTQAALSTMQIDVLNKESLDLKYPHERFEYINQTLTKRIGGSNFFTGFLVNVLNGNLQFTSAGHPAQYLIRTRRHKMEQLQTQGKLIGVVDGVDYGMGEVEFQKDDTLILFTDGIFEEFNSRGQELGFHGFRRIIQDAIQNKVFDLSPAQIMAVLLNEVEQFLGGVAKNDDITMIIAKRVQ